MMIWNDDNEIDLNFSWERYDNIQTKAFNDKNEIDDINVQTRNKIIQE